MTAPKLNKLPNPPKGNDILTGTGVIVPRRFDLNRYVHELVHAFVVDYSVSNLVANKTESDFVEMPVSFKTFVESTEHMGWMPLSERQMDVVDFMLGDDPDKMFSNLNSLAILLWGKGSLLGHQEMITADGHRFTLEECAKRNLPIRCWTKTAKGAVDICASTPAIKKPAQERCFKVTTSFGHVSEASADHKYFTVGGWKRLEDLKKGDWICAAQHLPVPAIYNESVELCRWIGYMIGDGNIAGDRGAGFFAAKPDIISDYSNVVARFGGTVTVRPHNTPASRFLTMRFTGKRNGNLLMQHAKRLGIYGHTAATKRIPVEIMFSTERSRVAFLEALYATDGWYSSHGQGNWEIGYVSKNRKLIDDLDFMLKGFGIVGKIRPKYTMYKGERRQYWQHVICHKGMQRRFLSKFNVLGKQVAEAKMRAAVFFGQTKGFLCPPELTRLAEPMVAGLTGKQGATCRGNLKAGQVFSYDNICGLRSSPDVANDSLIWERIDNIEPLGMRDVYTFTVPGTHNYLQGGLFHHNSGKDAICVLILCYACYTLMCMRSPQKYFKFPEGEYIDCVNVAPSGDKASTVFFEKLRQRILRWQWLKDKYPVRNSGAFVSQLKPEPGDSFVTLTKDGVIFPKLIRLLSRNSANESAEGLNTLIYTLDEASAFSDQSNSRNADKLYRSLRSSSRTRFGAKGKGFIISFPREINDFTMRMYNANLGNLHVYTDKAATWEVLPKGLRFTTGNFLFEGKLVPNELKEDFTKNPTEAKMMYMADPPESEHGFIEYPEKIMDCVIPGSRGMVDVEDYIKDGKVCKRILSFAPGVRADRDYVVTVDLGRSEDTAALSVFHKEDSGGQSVFAQDMVTGWTPDKPNKYVVSFTDITEFILALSKRINIIGCWFDQWQSVSMRETLSAHSIPAHEYMLDYADHKILKELLYTKRLRLLPFEPQLNELRKLTDTGTRIDHPRHGHCFTGDTTVSLCDGRELSFIDLVKESSIGKVNWVYSIDHAAERIRPMPIARAWCTNASAKVVEVELDSGEVVRCTPDHRFMLRDGSYRAAAALAAGDSLMPLYRRFPNKGGCKGYRLYYEPFKESWHFEHRQFVDYSLKKGKLVHHINHCKTDNTPTNLKPMSKSEHILLHNRMQSEAERSKRSQSITRWHSEHRGTAAYASRSAKLREANKSQAQGIKRLLKLLRIRLVEKMFNVRWVDLSTSTRKGLGTKLACILHPEYCAARAEVARRSHKLGLMGRAVSALLRHNAEVKGVARTPEDRYAMVVGRRQARLSRLNHKVAAVRHLDKSEAVYDLEVEGTHNFAVSAGVFVHNSDYSDTITGAIKIFMAKYKNTNSGDEWGDVETIEENLHMEDATW